MLKFLSLLFLIFPFVQSRIVRDHTGVLWIPDEYDNNNDNDNDNGNGNDNNLINNKRRLISSTYTKEVLLQWHNNYRNITAQGQTPSQPSATNMNSLFWDEGLAAVAQAYSAQCVWSHNGNRVSDLQTYESIASFKFDNYSISVGENLYASTGSVTNSSLVNGIYLWYAEYSLYTYSDPFSYVSAAGHYTQLVWADTRYVGCGYTVCPTLSGTSYTNALFLVCDYFPAGNVGSGQLYQSGTSCSNCPSDRTSCSAGLCSGCQSKWYTYCDDYYSNCASLTSYCPSSCSLSNTNYLCTGCRSSCKTCNSTLLSSPSTCTNGISTVNSSSTTTTTTTKSPTKKPTTKTPTTKTPTKKPTSTNSTVTTTTTKSPSNTDNTSTDIINSTSESINTDTLYNTTIFDELSSNANYPLINITMIIILSIFSIFYIII